MDYPPEDERDGGEDGDGFLPPRIAGFRTGRLLGRGGSALVWLIEGVTTGEPFALKVTTSTASGMDMTDGLPGPGNLSEGSLPNSGGAGADAGRELRLLQRFAHEHLIRVHELVLTDQGPAVRLDYAPGGSLLQLVASRGPLPVGEAVTVLAPIAQVLAYLHSEGVAHGDVSPGNILFTAEGKPLLSDLGVGRLLGEGTGAAFGTPGFIGPFVGRGKHSGVSACGPELDTGMDVFALAAVAWFVLTGRVPGPAAERAPLSLLVPGVPAQLMELIGAGLSEADLQRPTAAEFASIVLGSGTPLPVDLVGSVHESVLPQLRTRRNDQNKDLGRRRRPGRAPAQPGGRIGRSSARKSRSGGGSPLRGIIGGGAAALLLGGGLAFGVPILTSGGAISGIIPELPVMPAASDRAGQPAQLDAGPLPTSPPSDLPTGPVGEDPAVSPVSPVPAGPPADPSTGPQGESPAGSPVSPVPAGSPADLPTGPQGESPAGPPVGLNSEDPLEALTALAEVRASAFTEADPSRLDLVNVADSPAMSADAQAVTALSASGRQLDGLRITVEDAERLDDAPGLRAEDGEPGPPGDGMILPESVSIAARAAVSGYTQVTDDGTPASGWMPAETQDLVFVLRNDGGGWKIYSVHEPEHDEQ